jgi:hypothetical protein
MWLTPTEEELFLKYNPELQKRSLENRQQKQQDFDDFVNRLKVYSKSDKPSMSPLRELRPSAAERCELVADLWVARGDLWARGEKDWKNRG